MSNNDSKSKPPRKPKQTFTKRRRMRFLQHLRETGNTSRSAELVGVHYNTVRHQCKTNPQFRRAVEIAKEEAVAKLEEEARRRAVDGYEKPVYYKGQQVGTETVYSDQLLITLLKGNAPEKYANKTQLDVSGEVTHNVTSAKENLLNLINKDGVVIEQNATNSEEDGGDDTPEEY